MEESKKRKKNENINKITNRKQFERLAELMDENVELAKGTFKFGQNKLNNKESWDNIAKQINEYGPPLRDGAGWNKVWKDWKYSIRQKLTHNKAEHTATGGGTYSKVSLTELEESIANLLCLENVYLAKGKKFGAVAVPAKINEEIFLNIDDDGTISPLPEENYSLESTPLQSKPNKKPNQFVQRTAMLQEQNEMQTNFFNNLTKSLGNLEKQSAEQTRYLRKIYDLKKEKVQAYKKHLERKSKLQAVELEIKTMQLMQLKQ